MPIDDELFDGDAADQVLGDDALENARGAGVIPHAFGVDDGDRPLLTETQAVCFRARPKFQRPKGV